VVLRFTIAFLIAFGPVSSKSDTFFSYNLKFFLHMQKYLDSKHLDYYFSFYCTSVFLIFELCTYACFSSVIYNFAYKIDRHSVSFP
jgi:hypothetical protein